MKNYKLRKKLIRYAILFNLLEIIIAKDIRHIPKLYTLVEG